MHKIAFIIFIIITLTACSNKTATSWQQHQYFNFAQVHHYQLTNSQTKFAALANLPPSEQALVELTLEKALSDHGILVTEQTPDVWVSFYLVQQVERPKQPSKQRKPANKIRSEQFHLANHNELAQYNQLVHFCWQCLSQAQKQKLEQNNTFILDFIDPKTKNSIWRSSWLLNWKDDDNSQQRQQKLQQALSAMLLTYPVK